MRMIEGLQPGAAGLRVVNYLLQLDGIHGICDHGGAWIGLRIERVQLVLNVFQAVNTVAAWAGKNYTAALFGKCLLRMLRNLFARLFR